MEDIDGLSDYDHALLAGFHQQVMHSIYCVQQATFTAPSWTWFVTPFDWEIWFLLATSVLFFGLVLRSVEISLDVLFYFIYVPVRNIKRFRIILIPSLIFISFLSYHYESFTTTQLTAPLHILSYETTKDLVLAGYRFVLPDKSYFPLIQVMAGKQYSEMMGRQVTLEDAYFDKSVNIFRDILRPSWFNSIAKYKGYVPMREQVLNKLGKSEVKVRMDKVSCFVTKTYFVKLTFRLMVYGNLAISKDLARILVWHVDNGIWMWLGDLMWVNFMRRMSKERFQEECLNGCQQGNKLKLSESVGLLFIVHAVLSFVSVIIYLMEDYERLGQRLTVIVKLGRNLWSKLWSKSKRGRVSAADLKFNPAWDNLFRNEFGHAIVRVQQTVSSKWE